MKVNNKHSHLLLVSSIIPQARNAQHLKVAVQMNIMSSINFRKQPSYPSVKGVMIARCAEEFQASERDTLNQKAPGGTQ